MRFLGFFVLTSLVFLTGCSKDQTLEKKNPAGGSDPYLWLEEIESAKALGWVKAQNEKYLPTLEKDPRFKSFEREVRDILLAKDRIPSAALRNGWIYNFWQDEKHVRGIWRRTRPDEFKKADAQWETVLDLDALAADEKENWVWKGSNCLPPEYEQCLLSLSRGGKDAVVVREFDVTGGDFVESGFALPEAKSDVAWKTGDELLVATDFGPGTLTESGYPRIVKVWKRGTPLAQAVQVFEGKKTDVAARGYTLFRPEGTFSFVGRYPTFFTEEVHLLQADLKTVKVPLPEHADYKGAYGGFLLAALREDWGRFKAGALVSLPVAAITETDGANRVELVLQPDERSTLSELATTKSAFYLNLLSNVQGKVVQVKRGRTGWQMKPVDLPPAGVITVVSSSDFDDRWLANFQSFLVPPSLYLIGGDAKKDVLKALPAKFEAGNLTVGQYESTSKDGVKVPYFVIHKKDMPLDGKNPTNLYGYGGFEISSTPFYLNEWGKVWSERGGVYVVANIRGGGEFGPKWHQAALKENRQRAFDDFISVAEDLIKRKITSARRLSIEGGSNGGLLVGATFTQRPDLFNAVICQVPLLDMLRFHKLLAGHSWTAEYGNPDDPAMAAVIAKYSPYQNLKAGVKYPKAFIWTSTKDDRVHPGHARKMVARLQELGNDVLYYENIEGGHGGAANIEQRIRNATLEFTYLNQQLVD